LLLASGVLKVSSSQSVKLNPSSRDEVGFHHKVISPTEGGFIPSVRTDLVEKIRRQKSTEFFWVYFSKKN
ncbi:MAG: hypothetical protein Q4B40_05010, partial [Clostridia bacterium]|nr:hypothetical protein [Clostridia bacterium]